jgi:aspartate/methionine/tyrosine aminotransferase
MTFAQFQQTRELVLRERPKLRDCSATNLYAALARHIPTAAPAPAVQVHRCHLATEWLNYFGFPVGASRRALISSGVRDSLALLFRHYAGTGVRLWLPSDNYPVYGELGRAADMVMHEFPTLPAPRWPASAPEAAPEILLVTNPLKPLGRWLTGDDVSALTAWLAADARRRLLLDTVYTFGDHFHPTTLQLLATGQTILLHSLTKGWLHPRLFGVALVPESDVDDLAPIFRAHPPSQSNLARARELMATYDGMPSIIARELEIARSGLAQVIPTEVKPSADGNPPGYFFLVAGHWNEILEKEHILGLPATVFGSARMDITILSSLSFVA